MSSILKALQKLEKDKSTRKTREPDISTAIKMSGIRTREYPAWLIPFVIVTVAAVSILLTFSLMGGFSRQPAPQTSRQPVQPPPPSIPNLQQSEQAPAAVETTVQSELIPAAPAANGRKPVQQAFPELPVPPVSEPPARAVKPAQTVQEPAPEYTAPAAVEEKPAPKQTLTVSGIAWQSSSASRIAVVNGSSVSEGSSVGGAKVEQIFPDRVRFSKGGEGFEIFLNQEGQR